MLLLYENTNFWSISVNDCFVNIYVVFFGDVGSFLLGCF